MSYKYCNIYALSFYERMGRILCYYPDHPNAQSNGYVYRYRLVVENHLGRYLEKDEIVHHKDANSANDHISNLECSSLSEHASIHNESVKLGSVTCPICGKWFKLRNSRRSKYCSVKCADKGSEKITWPAQEELEKLVWEMSTVQLAKKLGVSDVAIAKRCKKYGIKKPPRGYWKKKEAGKTLIIMPP